jgi:anti-sigma-K factor RskA
MWPRSNDDRSDPASWLTAYVDGELNEQESARVEEWLAGDPAARAEVDAQRRLKALWEQGAPADPTPAAFDAVRARIEAGRTSPAPASRHRARLALAAALATAAAATLAFFLNRPAPRPEPEPGPRLPAALPLEVVDADEVVIEELDAADRPLLVVGQPPVTGPLVLAGEGEVVVDHMESFPVHDRKPYLHAPRDGSPMLVAPMSFARGD